MVVRRVAGERVLRGGLVVVVSQAARVHRQANRHTRRGEGARRCPDGRVAKPWARRFRQRLGDRLRHGFNRLDRHRQKRQRQHGRHPAHHRLHSLDRLEPVFLDDGPMLARRQCKLDGRHPAGRQIFAVDPKQRALGLRGHLKHRHLGPKRIAPRGRVLPVGFRQSFDGQVLAEIVERFVVAPELPKHDGRIEECVPAPYDAQAVDVRSERALQQLGPLGGTRTVRLLEQPVPFFEVDARLRVLRAALGSREGRARHDEGDEHGQESSKHWLEVCLNR